MATCLRRASTGDAAAVRDLVRAAYAQWVPIIGREPAPMLADYDHAVRNHIVDMLFVDGQLTGVIELVVEPECVFIENVAVRPDAAGKGHGWALMAHAAKIARMAGRERLRLCTNALMTRNIAFYQRLGYAVDRKETLDDREIVYMTAVVA
jgi:N-acetylglutamate synthase-like GNAT family acetyltransferase